MSREICKLPLQFSENADYLTGMPTHWLQYFSLSINKYADQETQIEAICVYIVVLGYRFKVPKPRSMTAKQLAFSEAEISNGSIHALLATGFL